MNVKLVVSLALLAAVGLSSNSVVVAGWETQAGSACQAYFGSEASQFSAYSYTGKQRVSSGNAWLTCPMQRTSNIRSTVNVNLYHPYSNNSTSCYLMRANYSTGAFSYKAGTVSGSGNKYIGISASSGMGTPTVLDPYAISCYMPYPAVVQGTSWWAG